MMAADKWEISMGVRCQANYAVTVRTITPHKDTDIYTLSLLMVGNTTTALRHFLIRNSIGIFSLNIAISSSVLMGGTG